MQKFLPVILGTDVNAYGMARSFHMEYGVKSKCIGKGKLFMTDLSDLVESITVIPQLDDHDVFVRELIQFANDHKEVAETLILVASSDSYAELVIRNKETLAPYYALPFVDAKWIDEMLYKDKFYEICEKYGLDYPDTSIVTFENYATFESPFAFPVALKPADSVAYLEVEFEGKQKAFIIKSAAQLKEVLANIYASGYKEKMILQDFIPGDDTNMRVLNAYCDQHGKVKMMCLGRPLLEDCTPALIGNYVAIVNEANDEIYAKYKQFLEAISYTGYANFDMKYDARDGKYKVFEINLRQGRSSFFSTGSGYNLARYAVEDFVYGNDNDIVYGDTEHLWLGVPAEVAVQYIEDPQLAAYAKKLIDEGKYCTTLNYSEDRNELRAEKVANYYNVYVDRFAKFFTKKGDN